MTRATPAVPVVQNVGETNDDFSWEGRIQTMPFVVVHYCSSPLIYSNMVLALLSSVLSRTPGIIPETPPCIYPGSIRVNIRYYNGGIPGGGGTAQKQPS